MRLGVLTFTFDPSLNESMLDPLRARDVDIVTGDGVILSLEDALREAKHMFRADCDGVLLLVGDGLQSEALSAAAALLAGVPLLLAAYSRTDADTYFGAVGLLESIGARFDRIYFVPDESELSVYLAIWLEENGKKQRHRGLEAVRKLYGQCLYIPQETGGLPDAALWLHQIGIIATSEVDLADFAAEDGDACGALTAHLLSLVSGEQSMPVPVAASAGNSHGAGEASATFAQITRKRGHFRCLLLRGALRENEDPSARFDCFEQALFAAAASPRLHAVTGDHFGAMRAACDALDIETVLLRPA